VVEAVADSVAPVVGVEVDRVQLAVMFCGYGATLGTDPSEAGDSMGSGGDEESASGAKVRQEFDMRPCRSVTDRLSSI